MGDADCPFCGTKYLSDEQAAALDQIAKVGAPTWGRICISFRNDASRIEACDALRVQWEHQEQVPTHQILFPFQAEKFSAPVDRITLFAPQSSMSSLAKFVEIRLSGKVDLTFTQMSLTEIYSERDAWLAQRKEVSAQEAYAYHKATGCPISRASQVLAAMSVDLRIRVQRAVREQRNTDRLLHDPLENDQAFAAIIKDAGRAAEAAILVKGPLRRGSCHAIWQEQARILLEQHEIAWFSPQQMNPDANFD